MTDMYRALNLDAERQKKIRKFNKLGLTQHVCACCGETDVLALHVEHPAGRLHDDAVVLMCANCHLKRTADQRSDPSPSNNPHNVFEVIGRWLLSIASYFELLRDKLRLFGSS